MRLALRGLALLRLVVRPLFVCAFAAVVVAGGLALRRGDRSRSEGDARAPASAAVMVRAEAAHVFVALPARSAGDSPSSLLAPPRGAAAGRATGAYRALKVGFSEMVHSCVAESAACRRAAHAWNDGLTLLRGPGGR